MPVVMQQPDDPDSLSRRAGKDIYGTSVGMLRRVELWRLGNAWGMNFPAGATKDFMLPFFKQIEADGKNPFFPPNGGNLDQLVKARDVVHSDEDHTEKIEIPEDEVPEIPVPKELKPEPVDDFQMMLLRTSHAQLKKMCKLRGIEQKRNDSKQTLVARIMANVQDTTERR